MDPEDTESVSHVSGHLLQTAYLTTGVNGTQLKNKLGTILTNCIIFSNYHNFVDSH